MYYEQYKRTHQHQQCQRTVYSPSVLVCVHCNVFHDVVHLRSAWNNVQYGCVCAEHWGQRQVQQWAKLDMLAVWMQPVSVAHAASGSDSDTPINHCTLPGNLQQ